MKSYQEVARECELEEATALRYVRYMRARWGSPEDENIKCMVGYAREWAMRFKSGIEFQTSDSVGQSILKSMGN